MATIATYMKAFLVGKRVKHTNSHGRDVVLEVEDVKFNHCTTELEAATPQNDWWPRSETRYWLDICFVDGSKMEAQLFTDIKVVE